MGLVDGLIPTQVFEWLLSECQRSADMGEATWIRLKQRKGLVAIQFTSYVGVIRAPNGYQIEVLPKTGEKIVGGDGEARQLLIKMLACLPNFRHVRTRQALLKATRMPLLEIFIGEFLSSAERIVKRGLRSAYNLHQGNLYSLRGKLIVSKNVSQNLCRADRFYTEHDVFTTDRPENRLLSTALRRARFLSKTVGNQKLSRELGLVFSDMPESQQPKLDFQRVRLDRGMAIYEEALAWARLIIDEESPLTGMGRHGSPSLLFPMEVLFEAYVAERMPRQIKKPLQLKAQARKHFLVRHLSQDWFMLKPDLLIRKSEKDLVVLDTKWKLLDASQATGQAKYGLAQGDFYQLMAYGLSYLDGEGDVILVYPKTADLDKPLPVFEFPKARGLNLWVLPFCLKTERLMIPEDAVFDSYFEAALCNAG